MKDNQNFESVAIQGHKVAYTDVIASRILPDLRVIYMESFEDVFEAFMAQELRHCVLPFRNSIAGDVELPRAFLDTVSVRSLPLLRQDHSLPIHHCLLGCLGADILDIKTVFSHYMAIKQCGVFLDRHNLMSSDRYGDTAKSAKCVADRQDKSIAAIASQECAEFYGLQVLATNIADNPDNVTHFAHLAWQI